MTECERIIQEGILPKEFFREETRCDFYISEERKKLWAIELDLLIQLDFICRRHGIQYFLSDGSLLGAVRHNGFVPWDDDIDVGMFRNDYNRFLKVAEDELQKPYFLQTPYTDSDYGYSFAKIKNSNTTWINNAFRYQKYDQGIGIDIFPYDKMLWDDAANISGKINELNLDNSAYMRKSNPNPSEKDIQRIKSHSGRKPLDVYEEIQEIACKYNHMKTGYVGNAVLTLYPWNKRIYREEIFSSFIDVEFEGKYISVPFGYDEYLRTQYGDWEKFPPLEERGQWHSAALIDPDVPYKEYLIERLGIY